MLIQSKVDLYDSLIENDNLGISSEPHPVSITILLEQIAGIRQIIPNEANKVDHSRTKVILKCGEEFEIHTPYVETLELLSKYLSRI